jgi:hypothetical protein
MTYLIKITISKFKRTYSRILLYYYLDKFLSFYFFFAFTWLYGLFISFLCKNILYIIHLYVCMSANRTSWLYKCLDDQVVVILRCCEQTFFAEVQIVSVLRTDCPQFIVCVFVWQLMNKITYQE